MQMQSVMPKVGDRVVLQREASCGDNIIVAGHQGDVVDIERNANNYHEFFILIKFDGCKQHSDVGYCDGFPINQQAPNGYWLRVTNASLTTNHSKNQECVCSSHDLAWYGHLPTCGFKK